MLTVSNLTNTGGTLISDSSGLLQLAGNFTTGNLGTITVSNSGSVELTGTLDNTGATLAAPTGGTFLLSGTIKNGNIVDTALTQKSGTLDGAKVLGNLTVAGGGSAQNLTLKNGATFTGTANLGTTGQNGGILYLDSNLSTLAGSTLALQGINSFVSYHNSPSTFTIIANSDVTRTGAGGYTTVFDNLANSGNIIVSGGTLFMSANVTNSANVTVSSGGNFSQSSSTYNFTNTGTANVTGSGSVLTVSNLTNTGGTLLADSSGLLQLGGNFITSSLGTVAISNGGIVELSGNLTNTGATLAAPTGGAFTLTGTITGGNIADTALIPKSGTLDAATVVGNATVAGGASPASLILRNGAAVTGNLTVGTAGQNGGSLLLGSDLSLTAGSNLILTGSNTNVSWTNTTQPTLTVVPTSTLTRTGTGATGFQDHLVNSGTITISSGTLNAQDIANAASITVAAGSALSAATGLTQTGGSLRVDGSLFPSSNPGLIVQSGLVSGTGLIQGTTTFNGGTLSPGNSGVGTLTFTGNLTLLGGATTTLELGAGTAINDKIVVNGGATTLTFGGALNIFALSNTYTSGQSWTVFSFPAHAGSFASISLPNTGNGWVWDTSQLTTTGVLTLTTFVPVPEPSTYVLLTAGLGGLFAFHRRRRR